MHHQQLQVKLDNPELTHHKHIAKIKLLQKTLLHLPATKNPHLILLHRIYRVSGVNLHATHIAPIDQRIPRHCSLLRLVDRPRSLLSHRLAKHKRPKWSRGSLAHLQRSRGRGIWLIPLKQALKSATPRVIGSRTTHKKGWCNKRSSIYFILCRGYGYSVTIWYWQRVAEQSTAT